MPTFKAIIRFFGCRTLSTVWLKTVRRLIKKPNIHKKNISKRKKKSKSFITIYNFWFIYISFFDKILSHLWNSSSNNSYFVPILHSGKYETKNTVIKNNTVYNIIIENKNEFWFDLIRNIRMDSLSQILTYSNLAANRNVMILESCKGLLLASVVERLAGHGNIINLSPNGSHISTRFHIYLTNH